MTYQYKGFEFIYRENSSITRYNELLYIKSLNNKNPKIIYFPNKIDKKYVKDINPFIFHPVHIFFDVSHVKCIIFPNKLYCSINSILNYNEFKSLNYIKFRNINIMLKYINKKWTII